MITIDGNYLEGGGQIMRTAAALSVLVQKAFVINNIRAGRPKPGLKAQHLHAIKAFEKLCNAQVEGAELGSTFVKFVPGKMKPQTLSIDIGTAGSITLLLQSLLLPCMFSGTFRLKITGGTDVTWSPRWDYFTEVIVPQLNRYAAIEAKVLRRGYYPKGQGKVDVKTVPKFSMENISNAKPLHLTEQGRLVQIKGVSHAAKELEHAQVAERQAKAAKSILGQHISDCTINIRSEYVETSSIGSGLTLFALYSHLPDQIDFLNPIRVGADVLGEKGKRSEEVAKECCDILLQEMNSLAPVDAHLADNLIPLLGLVGGKIKTSKITNHTKTNIYVVEKFLDVKFSVDEEQGMISCQAH